MKSASVVYQKGQWQKLPDDFPNPTIAILFADRILMEQSDMIASFRRSFPNCKLISCSSAGEVLGSTVTDSSAHATFVHFEKTDVQFATGNINNFKNSVELGKKLASQLPSEGLKYVMVVSDGNIINGDALVDGIQTVIDKQIIVSGGLAGDAGRFQKTLVGLDDDVKEGNVVLMGLYGSHIHISTGVKGGWDQFGPERVITKSKGSVLNEIDGSNALELYKKYLGKYAEELPASALLFPMSVRMEEDDSYVVRTILSIDDNNGSMKFAGTMPEGSKVRFMKSNVDRLINAASDAATFAMEGMGQHEASLAMIVSCVGRKLVLSDRIEEEVEAVAEKLPASATITGFFSYGEVAPHKDFEGSQLHNQTITITLFSESV